MVAGQQGAGMFGGLALQASAPARAPAPSATGLDSLMGFGPSTPASAHTGAAPPGGASAAADLFGGLSLGKTSQFASAIHSLLGSGGQGSVSQASTPLF